jgi:hypothetical protein
MVRHTKTSCHDINNLAFTASCANLVLPYKPMGPRMEKLGRFLLRGLRIGASTVSIVELLRNDWTGGITAGVAWLVFLQVEQRLPPTPQAPKE